MSDAKPSRATSANAEGLFEPFSQDAVPWDSYEKGRFGSRFKQLGRFGGGSHVGVVYEELAPGQQTCPLHYHMLEEEHVFVLAGSLTALIGDREYPMQAGDFVCFPAGQKAGHALINRGDQPCRYLLIGEDNPNDVCIYPKSGRIGVRLTGEGYRQSAVMDYWEGQDWEKSPAGPPRPVR